MIRPGLLRALTNNARIERTSRGHRWSPAWLACAVASLAAACGGAPSTRRTSPATVPPTRIALITDQTNNPGPSAGFYWVPPIVSTAAAFTSLDQTGAASGLAIRIDRLYADGSTDPTPAATFTSAQIAMVTGSSSASFPGVAGPFYGANWSPGSAVVSGQTYRVSVSALSPLRVLGVADVQVVADSTAAAAVDRARFTPLVVGNALPVVFRLENEDSDGDTVPDWRDNCPFSKNIGQIDSDGDGRGDVCQCGNVPNGTSCKTSSCKTGEACQNGTCTGGMAANEGGTCQTGDPCAAATETCSAGVCGGSGQLRTSGACVSGNPCKTGGETCNPSGVCSGGTNASGTTACKSGTACRTDETCNAGVCGGAGHESQQTSGSCTTGNRCVTGETCNGSAVCAGGVAKANGTACSDGNLCTPADTCQAGVCTPGPAVGLDDGNPCTTDTCTATGEVLHTVAPDFSPCDDGNVCTLGESCQAGVCKQPSRAACSAGNNITFYQSYEQGNLAEITDANPNATVPPTFIAAPGLFGQGMSGATSSELAHLTYAGASLAKPGSASYWFKTNDGHLPISLAMFDGYTQTNLFLVDNGTVGLGGLIYFVQPGQTTQTVAGGMSGVPVAPMAGDGRWHLLVVNWTPDSIGVSVDGAVPVITPTNWLAPGHVYASTNIGTLIYTGGSGYDGVADEPLILNRTMTASEIQWYWNQGAAAGGGANPAIAYFNGAGAAPCDQWDDQQPCTTDACTPASGITHTPIAAGTSCSDQDPCNGVEACNGSGQCVAGPSPVDDGNACTVDSCTYGGGVVHTPVDDGGLCQSLPPIMPVLYGIAQDSAGVTKAVFDYTTAASDVSISYGPDNGLFDANNVFIASPAQMPPQTFTSAAHAPLVVTLSGGSLTWMVDGHSVTATTHSSSLQTTPAGDGTKAVILPGGLTVNMDAPPSVAVGSWTQLVTQFDGQWSSYVALLTDGRVLMNATSTNRWYTLTPDVFGSYVNGAWTRVADSHIGREFGTSFVLPNGLFFLCGSEYADDTYEQDFKGPLHARARCEQYDPVRDYWTELPDMPETVADSPATELGDGRIMNLSHNSSSAFAFDPPHGLWSALASYDTSTINSEGDCTLLPDSTVLCGASDFARYVPTGLGPSSLADQWMPAGMTTTTASGTTVLPRDEFTPPGTGDRELGPMLLLHTGNVLLLGGNAHNGIFFPPVGTSTNCPARDAAAASVCGSWQLVADSPSGYNHGDSPATVERDGTVLSVVTSSPKGDGQPGDTDPDPGNGRIAFFEWNPAFEPCTPSNPSCSWRATTPPIPDHFAINSGNRIRMLNLPNGQILVAGFSPADKEHPSITAPVFVYTPAGTAKDSWAPTVTGVSAPSNGTFTLSGTQLNGLSEGASLGDDGKMNTNYPIVVLTDDFGHVYHGRTLQVDQMAPRPGVPGTCVFSLPQQIPNGSYHASVSANGVNSSSSQPVTVSGTHVTAVSGFPFAQDSGPVTWTVTISTPAPAGGTVVNLSSFNTSVASVPATVTVPQNATSETFSVTPNQAGMTLISAVTSTPNPAFLPASATFGWAIDSITGPGMVYDDTQATWAVMITHPAPPSGITVSLASDTTKFVTVPSTVFIPSGQVGAQFTLSRGVERESEGFSKITASLTNSSMSYYVKTGVYLKIGQMTFLKCGDEYESCFVSTPNPAQPSNPLPRLVVFGANDHFVYKSLAGSFSCTRETFDGQDPAFGATKACYISAYAPLGDEGNTFTLPSTADVAFGRDGNFKYQLIQANTPFGCDQGTFGQIGQTGNHCFVAPAGYTFIGNEGDRLTVANSTAVAFGGAGGFNYRLMSGTFSCNTDSFGDDPAYSHPKACYAFEVPFVASEGSAFTAPSGAVFFGSGTNGNFVTKTDAASGTCSNEFMDNTDPDVTHLKQCWAN